MPLGHYYLQCGEWKYQEEIVFNMEIRAKPASAIKPPDGNYVKVQLSSWLKSF